MDWKEVRRILDVQGTPTIYVIRNAFIHQKYEIVQPRLLSIGARTVSSLIRTQGIGDFFRIWSLARRDGLELEVTWIRDEVRTDLGVDPTEVFDPKYMRALFDFGYREVLNGETWKDFGTMLRSIDRLDVIGATRTE